MTYIPIAASALPSAGSLSASDSIVVTQAGHDVRLSIAALRSFIAAPPGTGSQAGTESPSGTTLTGTTGALYDAGLKAFTLVAASNGTLGVALNGTYQTDTHDVVLGLYFNHAFYQESSTGYFYRWNGAAYDTGTTVDPRGGSVTSPATPPVSSGPASPGRLGYNASTPAVRNTSTAVVPVVVPAPATRALPTFVAANGSESPNGKVLNSGNYASSSIVLGDGTVISLASTANAGMFQIHRNGATMSGIRLDLVAGVDSAPLASFEDAVQIVYYYHNCYVMTDHGLGPTWFKLEGSGPDLDTEADDPRITFLIADAVAPLGDPPYGLGSHPGSIGTQRFIVWLREFAAEVGTPAYVNAFLNGGDFSGWGNEAYTAASALSADSLGKNTVPVLGMPMARGGQAQADFTSFGNGAYDAQVKAAVNGYLTFFDEVHLRPGYEMNGTFMNWFWGGQNGDTVTGPLWLAAFKRIYTAAKQAAVDASASSGKTKTLLVTWNPCHQNYNASFNPKDMYPGNSFVDYHGLDIYSPQYTQDPSNWKNGGFYPTFQNGPADTNKPYWEVPQAKEPVNRVHYWDYPAAKFGIGGGNETGGTAGWGLQDAMAFALACGKPLAFPECGAGQNFADAGQGPAEDEVFPYYLRSRCDQFTNQGGTILYLNIWSSDEKDGGWGYMFRQRPKEAQAWRNAFGGTGAALKHTGT